MIKQTNPACWATAHELSELTALHCSVHLRLLSVVERTPVARWHTHAPGEWSASQIVEHIFLVERGLDRRIRQHLRDEPSLDVDPVMKERKALLARVLPGAGKAIASPALTAFVGLNIADVQEQITVAVTQFEELIDTMRERPVHAITWRHSIFGDLSGYLWALYIPLHTVRHAEQLIRRNQIDHD